MNNKEYFEKSIIPYRQKIRQLESENYNLKVDKLKLKEENKRLVAELSLNSERAEKLLEVIEIDKSDLLDMINKNKVMSKFDTLFSIYKDAQ